MDIEPAAQPPLWKRIWNFPLVAMLAALAVTVAVLAAMGFAGEMLRGALPRDVRGALMVIATIAALIAV